MDAPENTTESPQVALGLSSKIVTLEHFIIQQERLFPEAKGEFSQIIRDLALASKIVHREINKAGLVDILGEAGQTNVQGESQQKLDVFANDQFIKALKRGEMVGVIGSEENQEIIPLEAGNGKYVVLMDPLDGSSNIDVNVSVGTIFSIYKRRSNEGAGKLSDCLQRGEDQIAAGYILYGSSTIFVYTTGDGVNGFTLDASLGDYFLSHRNIRIPKRSKYYSINEGKFKQFDDKLQAYLRDIKTRNEDPKSPLVPRYIGSLVADFHRNLLKGGIFMYPGSSSRPQGKLRLMYEANPMAMIAEQAGGMASNGQARILELQPNDLHQRTPLFVGSVDEMEICQRFLKG